MNKLRRRKQRHRRKIRKAQDARKYLRAISTRLMFNTSIGKFGAYPAYIYNPELVAQLTQEARSTLRKLQINRKDSFRIKCRKRLINKMFRRLS